MCGSSRISKWADCADFCSGCCNTRRSCPTERLPILVDRRFMDFIDCVLSRPHLRPQQITDAYLLDWPSKKTACWSHLIASQIPGRTAIQPQSASARIAPARKPQTVYAPPRLAAGQGVALASRTSYSPSCPCGRRESLLAGPAVDGEVTAWNISVPEQFSALVVGRCAEKLRPAPSGP